MSVTTTAAAIDTDAVTKKVQALVDAYNAVVTATRAAADREERPEGDDDDRPSSGHAVR